jgi:hypothetical protein
MVTHCEVLVRLACIKHAASVRPEPGSNSPTKDRGSEEPNPQGESVYASGLAKPSTRNSSTACHDDAGRTGAAWRHSCGPSRRGRTRPSEACLTGFWHTVQLSRSRMVPATDGAQTRTPPGRSVIVLSSRAHVNTRTGPSSVPDADGPFRPTCGHPTAIPPAPRGFRGRRRSTPPSLW